MRTGTPAAVCSRRRDQRTDHQRHQVAGEDLGLGEAHLAVRALELLGEHAAVAQGDEVGRHLHGERPGALERGLVEAGEDPARVRSLELRRGNRPGQVQPPEPLGEAPGPAEDEPRLAGGYLVVEVEDHRLAHRADLDPGPPNAARGLDLGLRDVQLHRVEDDAPDGALHAEGQLGLAGEGARIHVQGERGLDSPGKDVPGEAKVAVVGGHGGPRLARAGPVGRRISSGVAVR